MLSETFTADDLSFTLEAMAHNISIAHAKSFMDETVGRLRDEGMLNDYPEGGQEEANAAVEIGKDSGDVLSGPLKRNRFYVICVTPL